MKTYNVLGNTTVLVGVQVKANSEKEAIAKAKKKFGGIREYAGNGGTDKLIGVDNENESIFADESTVDFDEAVED